MGVRESIIVSDPEVMNGIPCFQGTRVPLKNLMDYIEGGCPLAQFLEDFPPVSRNGRTGTRRREGFTACAHCMKLLLDECVPERLRGHLQGHEIHSVRFAGLNGRKNGELLLLAEEAGYSALPTGRSGIPYRHSPTGRRIAVSCRPCPDDYLGRRVYRVGILG
jgi:hypothetical protein